MSTNSTQYTPTKPSITTQSQLIIPTPIVFTTLFDKLDLNQNQVQLCKTNYNQVIDTIIIEFRKLIKLKKSNEYLNTVKQFDTILSKGIDNIMNHLTNTIKSQNILTRTSIRTDVLKTLSNTVEQFINKTNNELSKKMQDIALMNSTTIDYATMLKTINESRIAT